MSIIRFVRKSVTQEYSAYFWKRIPCPRCGEFTAVLGRTNPAHPVGFNAYYACQRCGYLTKKHRDLVTRIVGSDHQRIYLAA
jgi:hypothetical protein